MVCLTLAFMSWMVWEEIRKRSGFWTGIAIILTQLIHMCIELNDAHGYAGVSLLVLYHSSSGIDHIRTEERDATEVAMECM